MSFSFGSCSDFGVLGSGDFEFSSLEKGMYLQEEAEDVMVEFQGDGAVSSSAEL